MRVPGYVGIRGNETADRAAKEALDKEPTDALIFFSNPKPFTAKYKHLAYFGIKNGMKLSSYPIRFVRFYQSFPTNCYYFVRQGKKTRF